MVKAYAHAVVAPAIDYMHTCIQQKKFDLDDNGAVDLSHLFFPLFLSLEKFGLDGNGTLDLSFFFFPLFL